MVIIAKRIEIPVPEDRPDLARLWKIVDDEGNILAYKERPKIKPIPEPQKKTTQQLIEEIAVKLGIDI